MALNAKQLFWLRVIMSLPDVGDGWRLCCELFFDKEIAPMKCDWIEKDFKRKGIRIAQNMLFDSPKVNWL